MISHLQKRSKQLLGFQKVSSKKGFGWFDEGQKNQAGPVWNRVNLREAYAKIILYLADDGRNPKSNAPKAILADLAFTSLLFPSIQMTSMRSVAI